MTQVKDLFTVFTETTTDTLCLTLKPEHAGLDLSKAHIHRGEKRLNSIWQGKTMYLGISKDATCTSVKDCDVVFEHD